MSLYLLFAIGFKGGVALASADLGPAVWFSLGAAMLMSSGLVLSETEEFEEVVLK